jgi:hypothetical protein
LSEAHNNLGNILLLPGKIQDYEKDSFASPLADGEESLIGYQ